MGESELDSEFVDRVSILVVLTVEGTTISGRTPAFGYEYVTDAQMKCPERQTAVGGIFLGAESYARREALAERQGSDHQHHRECRCGF